MGLVTSVVPEDKLDEEVEKWVQRQFSHVERMIEKNGYYAIKSIDDAETSY